MGNRGGRRIGAGRKPKNPLAKVLQIRAAQTVPTTNEPSPIEEFDAPDDLTMEERAVWLKQAPHAFGNRTLTRASAMAFERYCKLVVAERAEAASTARGGANHRGLLKQINTLELQFVLVPCGKAMPVPDKPATGQVDPDAEFFGGAHVGGR